MVTILKNILAFITDPKNTRMLLLAGIAILAFLLLRQCNRTKHFKGEIEKQKQETQRVQNNYDAAQDSIKQYKIGDSTLRAEKLGYELTLAELEEEYSDLMGKFEFEKNKPPKTVVVTEWKIKDSIRDVLVVADIDSLGNKSLKFGDSTYFASDSVNYRLIKGKIPYDIVFDPVDSVYKIKQGNASVDLGLGMNLNVGLFQDKDDKKVYIKAETDYPGVKFTKLEGASIMDDPDNRSVLRQLRKPFSIGLNLGYGLNADPATGTVRLGPYFGFGINYSPKWLQFGK
jgi:hypothetical protein